MLCGTSKSECGFQIESNVRKAASLLDFPIICIEDFPGNYVDIDGSNTEILIVEGDFSKNIYKNRFATFSHMIACPSVRYDWLRARRNILKEPEDNCLSLACVLWAGQPEFDVNLYTLKALVPVLKELSVTLFFRAHPNDTEYEKSVYANYFDEMGLCWLDVTRTQIDSSLFDQVHLVVTQFSSVAIEAGFYGVPSLNILFEDAGEKLLLERTGSLTTNTIQNGASFVIRKQQGLLDYLRKCLADSNARKKVLSNFERTYETQRTQLPKLLQEIKDIIPDVMTK